MRDLEHGLFLQQQGRLSDAEQCFYNVIAKVPDHDFALSRLALCQWEQEGKRQQALESIEQAIRINPQSADYHGIKSLILSRLRKADAALQAADAGLALDPESSFVAAAKSAAYCEKQQWEKAEQWARQSLACDSDNAMAANLLTHALRLQGKQEENHFEVERLLAAGPENSLAHYNAGWSALHRGDHGKAEEHFRESLRIDPEMDEARHGLLESFRARSWLYRRYLAYIFFMQRFTEGKQWMIAIGAYVAYRLTYAWVRSFNPGLATFVGFFWISLVLMIWLAPSLGNFFIALDRSARMALKRQETWQGLVVGLGLGLGILSLVTGVLAGWNPVTLFGIGAIAMTIPASLTLTNESLAGRWVFGAATLLTLGCTVGAVAMDVLFSPPGSSTHGLSLLLSTVGVITAFVCTWMGNIRALREQRAS